jgi:hypothetical protein
MARSTNSDMTADASRMRRRRRILIRVLTVVAILGVLLAGAAVWLYRALPQIAAAEMGRWMNARVETGAFQLHRDGSVTVVGLVIRPKQDEFLYENTILRADHVYAKFSRRSLLSLSPRVTALGVEDFMLDVQLNLNTGRWNVGALRFHAPRGTGGDVPAISLKQGKLRYCKFSGVQQEVVMSIPIEAHFGPDPDGNPGYAFVVNTAKLSGGYGESHLEGHWRPSVASAGPAELTIAGGLSSTDIPSLERAWAIDILAGVLQYDREGKYSLDLSMKNVHGKHAPEVDMLRFIAPAAVNGSGPVQNLQKFFAEYQPTGIVGSIALKASGNIKRLQDSTIEGKLVCKDISICDSDFPYRLDHLTGELEFTQSTARANRLVGKHGPVEVGIDGWTKESGSDRQYHYQITSRNMVLDKDLYAALSPDQKQSWDAFRPAGTVSVDYRLSRTSPTDKRLYLSVDLNDVTAAFQGFPYPLAGLTGNLFFDRDGIAISNVVSKTGGRQIQVSGKVTERVGGAPKYYVSVEAQGIPLDATLRNALPARHREMFSRFDVNGLADIRAKVFSTDDVNGVAPARSVAAEGPNNVGPTDPNVSGRVSFLAEVSCQKGFLKLSSARRETARAATSVEPKTSIESPSVEGPALVLSDITAEATITPDSMSIRRLEGRYIHSPVTMTGGVLFGEGNKLKQCRMKITAQQMPLNEATIGLLPPSLARQAAAFHPEGNVDLVVDMKKADSNEPPAYTILMNCLGDKINHERFPYPLQDIRGTVTLAKDRIVLKNVTAKPQNAGPTTEDKGQKTENAGQTPETISLPVSAVRVDGAASLGQGALQGSFTLQATDMLFTENLGRALPETLAGAYRELSPQGPFDLDLTMLKVSQGAGDEILVEFGGKANLGSPPPAVAVGSPLKTCSLKAPGAAIDLAGSLAVEGSYSTKHGLSRGQARLAAERLVVKGKTATHTDLSAVYDPNTQKWTAENFVGDCYGGKLLGTLEIGGVRDGGPKTEGPGPGANDRAQPSSGVRSSSSGLECQLRLALHDVDLQQFLMAGRKAEDPVQMIEDAGPKTEGKGPAPSATSGTMDASLSLSARMGGPQRDQASAGTRGESLSRRGACHIDIANMQVGKVSPWRNVLSVLRLNEPTDYTFERMLIDSYIRADRLLISKLDLSGKSAAFTGSGTMDLPTEEVNLTLTARGQRVAAAGPSVLQSLREGLGGAVVRIEVTGKADSPHVQTKTLPVIEDSLKILGAPEENKKGKK